MNKLTSRAIGISLVLSTTTCALFACRGSETPSSSLAPSSDAGAISITLPAVDGSTSRSTGPAALGKAQGVAYAANGTLIVQLEHALVSIAPDGTRLELPLPPKTGVVMVGGERLGDTIAVDNDGDVLLIALSPLGLLTHAKGKPVGEPAQGIAVSAESGDHDDEVILASPGTTQLVHLKLADGLHGTVDALNVTQSGHYAVVSVSIENGDETTFRAFDYGLATGKRIGEVPPNAPVMMMLPTATFQGDHEISFQGNQIVDIDLASGAAAHQGAFPCKAASADVPSVRGNPIIDPSGKFVLATCNQDGVLFDGHTLQRLRTFKELIPGCDNGYDLPGHFDHDGKQLVIEGCGGEAHLDTANGRFLCGDSDELMGAPYPGMAPGPSAKPKRAVGVPRCHPDSAMDAQNEALSAHWSLAYVDDDSSLVGPNGAHIALPKESATPAVAPREDRFAVLQGDHVIVRQIPSGATIADIAF